MGQAYVDWVFVILFLDDEWVFLLEQPRQEISIELPDGSVRKGTSWETSPMDVAKELSKSLSERVVIAKVSVLANELYCITDWGFCC